MGTVPDAISFHRMSLDFRNIDAPCEEVHSCLAEKFSRLGELSQIHRELLWKFEDRPEEVKSGERILQQNHPADNFYVIKKGWVISSMKNNLGHKTVIDIHHAGDIVGVSQMAYTISPYSSYTVSNAVLCPFPRQHLDDLLKTSPRLAGMLQMVCMIEQSILHDRIAMMSGSEAHIRLCHFMLQTFCRLKFMNKDLVDQFYCPLNQATIGDAIGVTSVHVSRMFGRLAEMELLERKRNFIKFRNWDEAVRLTGFIDRYAAVNTAWLPEV